MCGHGTIGTITIAIEEGLIQPKTPGIVRMEAPAGLVLISYRQEGNKVTSVKLKNVPAYLDSEGLQANCPDLGTLTVDVAYGGNFYAIVDVQPNFPGLEHYTASQLVAWSRELRKTSMKNIHSFTRRMLPSTDARTFYGQERCWTNIQRHGMRFFMAIKPSTVRPAARALRHAWHNGMPKEN